MKGQPPTHLPRSWTSARARARAHTHTHTHRRAQEHIQGAEVGAEDQHVCHLFKTDERDMDGGARVGRCLPLPPLRALALAMGTHRRFGAGAGGRGRRMSQQRRGKTPNEGMGCAYMDMPEDLVLRIVEACRGWPEGGAGKAEGVVRLVEGGRGETKGRNT
jgi:hypothetical protein